MTKRIYRDAAESKLAQRAQIDCYGIDLRTFEKPSELLNLPHERLISLEDIDVEAIPDLDLQDTTSPEAWALKHDLAQIVRLCLEQMPARWARLIIYRYGFYGGTPRTYAETGREFGISTDRARQIETAALRKLRYAKWGAKVLRDYKYDK